MKSLRLRLRLPAVVALIVAALMLRHGPIAQLAHYHEFADQNRLLGIPHFADVMSNLGFALVALWGWHVLAPASGSESLRHGWVGYRLFLVGVFLTACGSSYYHLAPDNGSLLWDRLPIALSCAGLLAGVWSDVWQKRADALVIVLGVFAVISVLWWRFTDQSGVGDLRPYLYLQALPLLLIPLWQWAHRSPGAERLAFGLAIAFYVLAKWAELNDHAIATALGCMTGHTLKHLLATAAVWMVVMRLRRRIGENKSGAKSTGEKNVALAADWPATGMA